MALNVKQEAFCLHYAKTGNATEAYKKAGYAAKTDGAIYANANRLLKNDKVQERLKELAEEIASDKIAGIREIQERLTSILRMEQSEEVIVVEGCGEGCSTARTIDKMPSLKDVIKAGETLAKMQGGFDSKLNVTVAIPVFGGEEDLED
ncbi:MAG: terminase small subunit [Lachnospiraceae bacterium]|nr:terminase small subunit [Lachnospiraceae bacterium]